MPLVKDSPAPARAAITNQAKFEAWINARVEANVRTCYTAHMVYANYLEFCQLRGWHPVTRWEFHTQMLDWGFWSATARIDGREVLYYRSIGFSHRQTEGQ